MYVVVRELRHCFNDDREFLHARDILDHVNLVPADSHVPEEMQEQVVSGAGGRLMPAFLQVLRNAIYCSRPDI